MFEYRDLPTCKMLIRKSVYGFMISTKRSCNTILQNIVESDHIGTSPLLQYWMHMHMHASKFRCFFIAKHNFVYGCNIPE